MPRLTRSRAKADLPVSGSDAEMDVVEEDPIQDMEEPEIAVEGDGDEEEDESSEAKEDELEEDDDQVSTAHVLEDSAIMLSATAGLRRRWRILTT